MKKEEEDTFREDEITCPWCKFEYKDSWEYSDHGTTECCECEKKFSYYKNVSVKWDTARIKK